MKKKLTNEDVVSIILRFNMITVWGISGFIIGLFGAMVLILKPELYLVTILCLIMMGYCYYKVMKNAKELKEEYLK